MNLLDLTFQTPQENLACDEALLDGCEAGGPEVLRFWEPREHFVVLGYSNHVEREVNVAACRKYGVAILRRCSGGGAVLQGPGCLNYTLTLRMDSDPALQTVTGTNQFVMERHRAALGELLAGSSRPVFRPSSVAGLLRRMDSKTAEAGRDEAMSSICHLPSPSSRLSVRGYTDLALDDRKCSGNAQRRKRRSVLFHGTFLLSFDLARVGELLSMPSKQPDYRRDRSHAEFMTNLNVAAAEVKAALREVWQTDKALAAPPLEPVQALVSQKYAVPEWNMRR